VRRAVRILLEGGVALHDMVDHTAIWNHGFPEWVEATRVSTQRGQGMKYRSVVLVELDCRKLTWYNWPLISRTIGCEGRRLEPGSAGLGRLTESAPRFQIY
jgi:hypothetical protein